MEEGATCAPPEPAKPLLGAGSKIISSSSTEQALTECRLYTRSLTEH